jgi:hypothetical protein
MTAISQTSDSFSAQNLRQQVVERSDFCLGANGKNTCGRHAHDIKTCRSLGHGKRERWQAETEPMVRSTNSYFVSIRLECLLPLRSVVEERNFGRLAKSFIKVIDPRIFSADSLAKIRQRQNIRWSIDVKTSVPCSPYNTHHELTGTWTAYSIAQYRVNDLFIFERAKLIELDDHTNLINKEDG